MDEVSYAKVEAGSGDISFCDRIQEIIIKTKDGRTEVIERGTAYSLCVEATRTGVKLKEIIQQRIEPDLVSIKLKRWY